MADFEVGYTPTNLRLAIEKLGVTQAALAATLNVSPQAVRYWLMPVGTKSRRDMSLKYGLPYHGGAFCTDRMKTTPCKKYLEDVYGAGNYHLWLGMRIDEPKRLNKKEGFSYLADISDFEKKDVLDWWAKMPFDLKIKEHLGNCVFCIKKGVNKIALAAKDEPQLADKFIKMINMDDVRIVPSRTTENNAMYRQSMSLESIIDLYAEMPRDKLAKTVRSTFETGSCSESCEAFAEQMDLAL